MHPLRISPLAAAGGGAFLLGFAVLAVMAPLATYTVTLAVFGLPHVLSELRYVDRRFGRRMERRFLLPIIVLLPLIVAIRASVVFHLLPPDIGFPAELGLVALLALACARGPGGRTLLALLVGGTIGGATAIAPYATAVTLSICHNLTPLGFLWQIAPPARRGRVMLCAAAAFLGLPLLVASGWPGAALHAAFGAASGIDPLQAGPLAAQLFVYVPPPFFDTPRAVDLFTASVVAQGAHYATVIVILPLLLGRLDGQARGLVAWPPGRVFAALCVAAGAVSLARFLGGFAEARALYGVAASVHAWIEIPVLILALTGGAQPSSQSPKANDPALAMSETTSARSMRSPAIQAMRPASASTTMASAPMTGGQYGKRG
jgi:hypothetical protein